MVEGVFGGHGYWFVEGSRCDVNFYCAVVGRYCVKGVFCIDDGGHMHLCRAFICNYVTWMMIGDRIVVVD